MFLLWIALGVERSPPRSLDSLGEYVSNHKPVGEALPALTAVICKSVTTTTPYINQSPH